MRERVLTFVASALFLLIVFSFCACTNNSDADDVKEDIDEVYTTDNLSEERKDDIGYNVAELIYSKMTYEVLEKGSDYCELEVTAPDVKLIFEECYTPDDEKSFNPETFDDEVNSLTKAIESKLKSGEYKDRTVTVVVPYEDGEIKPTYELTDAFYGGLLSLRDSWREESIRQGATAE